MIKAKLRPLVDFSHPTVIACRSIVNAARAQSRLLLSDSRKKALAYTKGIRRRAKTRGYDEGFGKGQHDFIALGRSLENANEQQQVNLEKQSLELAYVLAEEIISAEISRSPKIFEDWITSAIEIMRASSRLTLIYHPARAKQITNFASNIVTKLMLVSDSSIDECELRLTSELGNVDFSWRQALRSHALSLAARPNK